MAESSQRLAALDALRGIAALGVVLFHYLPYYDQLYGHTFTPPAILDFGRYGVHLFFILSGFVILMTLERTRTPGWFGLARAFRLMPALWAGVAITFLMVHALGPEDRAVSFGSALLNVTLLHEYLEFPHVDGAYWSLVIEATFYCWIALLFYGLREWGRIRAALWLWVAISYAGVIWWKAIPDTLDFLIKDLLFVKYAPLFVSGMLIYRWYQHGRPMAIDGLLLAVAIGHALIAYKSPFNVFVLGCYGVFVLAVAGYLNVLTNRAMLWLGSLSYALYLVHQNIGYGVITWTYEAGLPGWAGVCLALLLALVIASAIHYSIEKPALRWFRKIRNKPAEHLEIPLRPTS
ncbi:acyltransferase [Marinobacter sp. NP-4(2019)]|uniref:acyltransferase family protein n=1 Tax=Marinobacter sp. NP-4(2019) TaxID=2488665 RepID=UPI000FC3DB59|nr:acyltransferase [Marinobacter sp. NP-4(2019)]AZT85279.1 acyltransferase [Marinobacter sp. NP-4(2019)]